MRSIDADALVQMYEELRDRYKDGICCEVLDSIINDINEAPTIDAVEVVRCKDCKHHEKFLFDDSKLLCWVHDIDIVVSPTDYCSYGERREDGKA
jgi:hypothetical protein